MAKKLTAHESLIEQRRKSLAEKSRQDLLLRRAVIEVAIRALEQQKTDWKTAPSDEEGLTIQEQYDLISEALFNLDPTTGPKVNLETGIVDLKTFLTGE